MNSELSIIENIKSEISILKKVADLKRWICRSEASFRCFLLSPSSYFLAKQTYRTTVWFCERVYESHVQEKAARV